MNSQCITDKNAFTLWRGPIGWLGLVAGEKGLRGVVLQPDADEVRRRIGDAWPAAAEASQAVLDAALTQLEAYFQGRRRSFELPLDRRGLTPFAARVLARLAEVPFGEQITYGALAARCGSPAAARAVGRVMAGNPFPIIVPCHRVVGADGALTGYSGGEGVATKEWLLRFEQERSRQEPE